MYQICVKRSHSARTGRADHVLCVACVIRTNADSQKIDEFRAVFLDNGFGHVSVFIIRRQSAVACSTQTDGRKWRKLKVKLVYYTLRCRD